MHRRIVFLYNSGMQNTMCLLFSPIRVNVDHFDSVIVKNSNENFLFSIPLLSTKNTRSCKARLFTPVSIPNTGNSNTLNLLTI